MQTLADLDAIGEQFAVRAQLLHRDGRTDRAVLAVYHAVILFGAVKELRRRGHR